MKEQPDSHPPENFSKSTSSLLQELWDLRPLGRWWETILAALLVSFALLWLETWMQNLIQAALSDREGTPPWIWGLVLISLILSLLQPLVVFLFLLSKDRTFSLAWLREANQLLIEQVRSSGKVLLWGLLLIIPGLIKLFQLTYVPLIVLRDREYQAGKVDALSKSAELFRKTWGRVLVFVLMTALAIPLSLTALNDWLRMENGVFEDVLLALGYCGINLVLGLVSCLVLIKIYTQGVNLCRH